MIGVARTSKDDSLSESLETQEQRLLTAGCRKVVCFEGVSGYKLLDTPEWRTAMAELEPGERLACTHLSRIGRKAYRLIGEVGQLIDEGHYVWILDQEKELNSNDELAQTIPFYLEAVMSHQERVEIKRRTTKALHYLRDEGGLKLGQKPKLTDADVEKIKRLHSEGVSLRIIASRIRKEAGQGAARRLKPVAVNTVQKALRDPDYLTLEKWHENNLAAWQRLGLKPPSERGTTL